MNSYFLHKDKIFQFITFMLLAQFCHPLTKDVFENEWELFSAPKGNKNALNRTKANEDRAKFRNVTSGYLLYAAGLCTSDIPASISELQH